MSDKELSSVKKEINQLKRKYERALALSTSYEERNELLKKIQQLEAIKQSPSQMKSFGKTFMKGLRVTGSSLWKAVRKGSANLSKNSPEFRELSKRKQSPSQPFSDLAMQYFPSQNNTEPVRIVKQRIKPIKMKKGKFKKLKKPKMFVRSGVTSPISWELP